MNAPISPSGALDDRVERLMRRLEREKSARQQAEALLEERSRELYYANTALAQLAQDLEKRVVARTSELSVEREHAMALAQQDQLTTLLNRRFFTSSLGDLCQKARLRGGRVVVVLVDMDDFKAINDTQGHEGGDIVLREVAQRLSSLVGYGIAARLGGDEFALALSDLPNDMADAVFAQRLIAALNVPVDFNGRKLQISASVGYASMPDHATSSSQLLRHADMALYTSKKAGKGRATGFTDDLRAEADERRLLELELVLAIEKQEIVPWYQTIVDGFTGRTLGVEVLARWHHPYRGLVLPGIFLPLAEERNLLEAIFVQVATKACAEMAPFVAMGKLNYVSLNVSPSQFKTGNITSTIAKILNNTGFPATALVVEITEDLIMSDLGRAASELEELSRLGIRIALDDFGTGYSNIASLSALPIQWIKLDRSLVRKLGENRVGQAIVEAVLQMAAALHIDVVAEGIETEIQSQWLVAAGCRKHQGFLYGRPGPYHELPCFADPTGHKQFRRGNRNWEHHARQTTSHDSLPQE
ncbi:putative bifunctional diguanylate cyclase/phosphodiesterase [Allorhizobium terrae]|uniref:EAL domain-containing protein n=1 Tax=Allorhizobium terrae TaxID=1848972 RepID=A0A4S4A5N2_9HYPH|nr:EAL domain-containing protein [Allorhizobium terrae]THF53850.1 EAL domain-containing protein [Allorhizobium terrae]